MHRNKVEMSVHLHGSSWVLIRNAQILHHLYELNRKIRKCWKLRLQLIPVISSVHV